MKNSATRNRLAIALSLACVLLSVPPAATPGQQPRRSDESWRRRAPKAEPPRPFQLPRMREVKLDNGLLAVFIEDRRTPMVTIGMGIPAGSVSDPADRRGLAEATAYLLTEGAGSLTAEQLAREIETLGGRISSSANDDYTEVSVSVVAENAGRMLDIMGDVVLRPSFPEKEVALYKENRVQKIAVQRQDPGFLVGELFYKVIYGPHPYSISAPTPASVAAMDRQSIEDFYKTHFTPSGSIVVVVGDFDAPKMESRVRAIFGEWKAPEPVSRRSIAMPEQAGRRVYLIDRPGSEQAVFRIGNLAVAQSDPDYFALLVANTILGGGTSSRLFLNLREQKGYAYDVFSSISAPRERGTFFGGSETRTEVALPAIKEMMTEFERMRGLKVTPADLQNAKNYLNGVFSLSLSTQGGLAGRVIEGYLLGLERNHLQTHRAQLESITADQVQQAARKYMLTDRHAIVVVGDAGKLKRGLSTLAPIELFGIDGTAAK